MSLSAGRVGVRADQVDSHGRVISPSFLNEIMEDLPEWTDLPVRVNGAEQLIPSNPSVPVTSPILADIDYPDERRNDQYFTYRESPTTVDGLAKIKSIKGNTLVWNQLVPTNWMATSSAGATFTSNGDGSYTINGTTSNNLFPARNVAIVPQLGHKYYVKLEKSGGDTIRVAINGTQIYLDSDGILEYSTPSANPFFVLYITNGNTFDNVTIKPQIFDLTAMGLNVTIDQFHKLFPLPYYSYDSGSLLSFNGTGIKTTGKNLLNVRETQTVNGITFTNDNGVITISGTATANAYFTTHINLRNGSYFIGVFNDEINSNVHVSIRNESGAYPLDMAMNSKNRVASLNNDIGRFLIYVISGTTLNNFVLKPMISFESSESFEPYTENTTNLPTETYFPTGMKSAGSVYDELLPTKAVTRIGAVDLGTLNWTYDSTVPRFYTTGINSLINKPVNDGTKANAVSMYTNTTFNQLYATEKKNMTMAIGATGTLSIINTSYSNATAFKTAMSGVYLYYELATPVELPTLDFGE